MGHSAPHVYFWQRQTSETKVSSWGHTHQCSEAHTTLVHREISFSHCVLRGISVCTALLSDFQVQKLGSFDIARGGSLK